MKKADVTFVAAWVFAAATSFFYACTMWFKMKLPYYYPTEHAWSLGKKPGNLIAQGWYGKGMFALGAAAILAAVVLGVLRASVKKDLSPAAVKWVGLAATAVTVACTGYILYYEFHRWGIF